MNKQDQIKIYIIFGVVFLALMLGMHSKNLYEEELREELRITNAQKDAQIKALQEEKAELQIVVDEVEDAEVFIRMVNPGISVSEAHTLAVRQVAKARKYNIPRELIAYRDWAEADLHWLDANRKGPCGEHSTAQVWRPTFYALRPTGDYNDMDQVYDAGTQYLADCYRTAQRWLGDADKTAVYRLTLAFYNAGMRHKPQVALYRARAHVRRVDGILAKAERLGVV